MDVLVGDLDHPEPSVEGQARRTAAIRASAARTAQARDLQREALNQATAECLGEITSRDLVLALGDIMAGNLDDVIQPLLAEHQADQLAVLDD